MDKRRNSKEIQRRKGLGSSRETKKAAGRIHSSFAEVVQEKNLTATNSSASTADVTATNAAGIDNSDTSDVAVVELQRDVTQCNGQ